MTGIMRFKKIKPRMIFWIFTAVLLPVMVVCSTIYYQRVTAIKTEAYSKLTAIRDLKVAQLNNWFTERRGDFGSISRDIEIRKLAGMFVGKELAEKNQNIILSAKNILNSFVENYRAYHEVFIINASTGTVEISNMKASEGLDVSQEPYFTEPLKTGSFFIRDIYYSNQLKSPAMCFAIPIKNFNSKGKKQTAVLVARIDLERSLYDLLLERTGMGKTGETLIVNKDLLALNELRWHENAPLKLKIGAKPAILASQGNVGVVEAKDYRGIDVLASYTYLPGTQWGFVAKQDISEIYAPIRKMLINIAIILLISIVFAYALAHMLAVNFSKPIIEFTNVARQIQEGNLSVRSMTIHYDEYGLLSRTFNEMAESIENNKIIQNALRSLDEILVTSTTVNNFGAKFIKRIVRNTKSNFGAFYLNHPAKNKFEHVFSTGFDKERMEALDESSIKGAFDTAFTTRKITYTKEISKDTVFTVNTIAGTALPRILVTIPILNKDQVIAMIALGSITDYSKISLEILEQLQFGTGNALFNIISGEKTNSLAGELKSKNIELEAQSQELQAMTDGLKQQNIELDVQSRKLEEASRLKSEFLSNMSHELRTPLNSVMALSSVLKMNAAEKLDADELEYLDVIKRNGKRLLDLINDILDLSKIEAGHMDVTLSFFQLESTIGDMLESLRPLANDKELSLHMEITQDLPKIQSDEKRVHQILLNLIGNAVKFTEKGEVTVRAYIEDDKICIKVHDTGIGILERDLPFIFEEFKQVDGSTSRPYEGTGLGLAIAYKATLHLGGDLSVESEPGLGTTFTLTLPVTWEGESLQAQALYSMEPTEMIENRKTILVVDDEPETVSLLAEYLSKEGYNTLKALSGAEALKIAKNQKPFAITLDLIMPEMDGLETLQKLKREPETSGIPVIIVSVSDDKKTGLTLGAVGHVTKPVTRNELMKEINKACSSPVSIMVADDSELDRNNLSQIIASENMQVILAENGKVCIEKIRETVPDVLVLDLMMPELDGFGVLKILRSDVLTMSLPVIIVTAKDLTPEEKEKLNQYATSVLYKSSLTSQSLLSDIGNYLRIIEKPLITPPVSFAQSKKRILVVEDNRVAIVQIKMILEQEGYHVDIAGGGREAQDFVQQTIPDGIILDLMMPDVDGFDVLEKIRGTKETAEIPVLILTAKDLTTDDFKRLSANNIQQLVQKGDVVREGLLLKVKTMLGEENKSPGVVLENEVNNKKTKIEDRDEVTKPIAESFEDSLPIVLVVEDNPDNMITIKAVLKDRYSIIEANDGEKGLKAVRQNLPDIVLLDMSLPGMDGYACVKEIKADNKTNNIPVIALTAHAMKGDREKIIAAGCDDYLSKPIDTEKILKKIEKWLEQS